MPRIRPEDLEDFEDDESPTFERFNRERDKSLHDSFTPKLDKPHKHKRPLTADE